MKKLISIFVVGILLASCVDDFTDSNPPRPLDAPYFSVSAAASSNFLVRTVPVNPFQNGYEAFVGYGQTAQLNVSVLRAPGKVSSVSVTPSIPEYGSVVLDASSVAALNGKAEGAFNFTFTPNPDLAGTQDRKFDLVITVTDSQLDTKTGEASPLTTTVTVPTTMAKAGCFSTSLQAKSYQVISASGNLDGSVPFTLEDLEADHGTPVLVTVTQVRAGRYRFNEITGGIWPTYYSGRASPVLDIDLCGNNISGHEGAVSTGVGTGAERKFTITGTLNEDGTITINWSYIRLSGTPAGPAMGSYTLGPL